MRGVRWNRRYGIYRLQWSGRHRIDEYDRRIEYEDVQEGGTLDIHRRLGRVEFQRSLVSPRSSSTLVRLGSGPYNKI